MKLTLRVVWLVVVLALSAAAQPQIYTDGVVNGAGFVFARMPNGAIAQGSIFSIFGGSMGPAMPYPAPSFPLQAGNGLAGYTVEIIPPGGGSTIFAIPLMVSLGQINAILPSSVPEGDASVVVRYNRFPSSPQTITVAKRSFGIFTANRAGSGPASLQNWYSSTNQLQNSVDEVAHPGQVVVLWGTGLGPVAFDETLQPGANAKDMRAEADVTVYVAGIPVKPDYAGRSPEFAGVDQINFRLPANVPTACYVPVTVMVDGVVSNTATMSIGPGSGPGQTCSDDFTAAPPPANQPFRSGNIMLTRISVGDVPVDTATASFTRIAAANVTNMHGTFGVSTYGACTVFNYKGDTATFAEPFTIDYLNAGTSLTLTLPDNTMRSLTPPPAAPGVYSIRAAGPALPLPFLVQGKYTINVPGGGAGADAVGSFQASVTVPSPLVWNSSVTSISRTSDLMVTWTGGEDAALIAGNSSLGDKTGAGFYCLARASDRQFTIPAYVLSALPPSSTGQLSVGNFPAAAKTRVSSTISGLNSATFGYQFLTTKPVVFQ